LNPDPLITDQAVLITDANEFDNSIVYADGVNIFGFGRTFLDFRSKLFLMLIAGRLRAVDFERSGDYVSGGERERNIISQAVTRR